MSDAQQIAERWCPECKWIADPLVERKGYLVCPVCGERLLPEATGEIAARLAMVIYPQRSPRDVTVVDAAVLLAADAGLRQAVEEMEALIELCDVPGPIEKHNLKRWFTKALAALKGEKDDRHPSCL